MQVTFLIPIVTMVLLMLIGLTLEGSQEGLYNLMKPDLRNLINPFVWAEAGTNFHPIISIQPAVTDECGIRREQPIRQPSLDQKIHPMGQFPNTSVDSRAHHG
jgi:hypothetical protein